MVKIILFILLFAVSAMAAPFSGYFVVPANLHSGNEVSVPEAVVSPTIISEGNLDPTKCYQIRSISPSFPNNKGYKVGDRFVGIGADISGKGTVSEVVGAYWMKSVNFDSSPVLGVTSTGKVIVSMLLKRHWVKAIKKMVQDDENTNTTAKQILAGKLNSAYIGQTRQAVFDRFPEITEETLMRHRWSFE